LVNHRRATVNRAKRRITAYREAGREIIGPMNSDAGYPPGGEDNGSLNPDVIEALISIDPHLSDVPAGELVSRETGEPMHPVEHVNILSATRRDIEAARTYLDAKRETDLARYEAIARLGDLTRPYDDGTMALADILPRMPATERAEAAQLLRHIRPTSPPGPLTGEQRQAEYARLVAVSERLDAFLAVDHPVLHDGQPVTHPDTGETIPDPYATLEAVDIGLEISRAIDHLHRFSSSPPEIVITADEAAAKLDALVRRVTPGEPGYGTGTGD
jgi:hypothetical protein